jgi:hypothetical protein
MPIQYRIDPGPMATSSLTGAVVITNSSGVARVNAMFASWAGVTTASVSAAYAGPLLASGAYTGGAVVNGTSDVANFDALQQSCNAGQQSPIVFDPNGNLASELGISDDLIGFEEMCDGDSGGHIDAALIFLEGAYQNGVNVYAQLTTNQFNQAITHEIGHFLGLGHSQINVDVLNEQPLDCNSSELAGLPVMFPFFLCQDRVSSGLPPLSPDDMAWISRLYPVTAAARGKTLTSAAYGTISGTVFFSDGVTETQDVNVLARLSSNPESVAFSAVSGYLFTANLGQSLTCGIPDSTCNSVGSSFGSRDTHLVGTFDIPVTPGTYSVTVESIDPVFVGSESVGPLGKPIPMPGTAPPAMSVTVVAGGSANVSITLTGTPPRFDSFETSGQTSELIVPDWEGHDPLWAWQRRADEVAEALRR